MNRILICLTVLLFIMSFSVNAVASEEIEEGPLVRGVVLDVREGTPTEGSFGEMESQAVTIRVLDTPYRDEIVQIQNTITGHPYYDLVVEPGDRVLLQVDTSFGETNFNLTDFSRDRALLWLTLFFALVLVAIGGIKGLKALVSLVIMALVVIYLLLPLILRGVNPVLATVGISSILTMIFLLFIGGFNKKTTAAILGTVAGLVAAGSLAVWIGRATYLTGLSSSEAQMLQYVDGNINFQGLLFAGIMLGALGAILDVGMSVSSAMEQIRETNPAISLPELIKRGMNVGRDMLGTMANTLILAYVGTSLPLLLLFQVHQADFTKIINLDLIATEVVRAMAGSVGLALAVPLTAIIAGLLQTKNAPSQSESSV